MGVWENRWVSFQTVPVKQSCVTSTSFGLDIEKFLFPKNSLHASFIIFSFFPPASFHQKRAILDKTDFRTKQRKFNYLSTEAEIQVKYKFFLVFMVVVMSWLLSWLWSELQNVTDMCKNIEKLG